MGVNKSVSCSIAVSVSALLEDKGRGVSTLSEDSEPFGPTPPLLLLLPSLATPKVLKEDEEDGAPGPNATCNEAVQVER